MREPSRMNRNLEEREATKDLGQSSEAEDVSGGDVRRRRFRTDAFEAAEMTMTGGSASGRRSGRLGSKAEAGVDVAKTADALVEVFARQTVQIGLAQWFWIWCDGGSWRRLRRQT